MTAIIDLNADIGELTDKAGTASERAILSFVSSCNIACGAHAGSAEAMRDRVHHAALKGVTIGAHPGYPDRVNFGRKSLELGTDIMADELEASIEQQVQLLIHIAKAQNATVHYVKAHGTLYTDAAKRPELASLIAKTVHRINPDLGLMGFPNSELERAARDYELSFHAEGFIDRTYAADGHLTARSHPRAIIEDLDARLAQALSLALDNLAHDECGQPVKVKAGSLCLHGDSQGALETARLTREVLERAGLTIASPYQTAS